MTEKYSKWGWKADPFVLKIDPSLFTGYEEQVKAAKEHIDNKHKIALITGVTGSGKTTFLRWLDTNLHGMATLYVSKPPEKAEEFIGIFTDTFGLSFFQRIMGRKPTLYNLPKYVGKKLKGQHLVFLLDEAHETNKEVLEWLRVLVDQIESVSLIMAGMPLLESKIKSELETLNQRITTRIELNSLTESETRDLIRKRIESVGGTGTSPFTENALERIQFRTGGFPREVLKLCDRLVHRAIEQGRDNIEASDIEIHREIETPKVRVEEPVVAFTPKPPSESKIEGLPYKQKRILLPYKQKRILEILSDTDWLTPTAISEKLDSKSYKSKGHAIRSINNILHRMMIDGFVQREARGKAFMYSLTPKVRTLVVKE
jgi:type II secretory pathway predicted ATPase ExeA